jgi:carbamoyl-phosphate synthase large subunit
MNPLTIAVSGLHRGENPQPGAGIIRSLRRAFPDARLVGLVYDIQESGIYVADGPDFVQMMPFPSAGAASYLQRLDLLRRKAPIDILIPTLDAEIELLVHLQEELAQRGIRVCLPAPDVLRRRAKAHLPTLAAESRIAVPKTRVAHDLETAIGAAGELGYPLMIKGHYYDAKKVYSAPQMQYVAARLLSEWGAPVILQRCVAGPEFNVLGIGDGRGGMISHCSIRKTQLSATGKGLGGITVLDPVLSELCENLVRELRWLGPFEIELICDERTGEYALIEMNPRFPAWIDFPAMIGANFAAQLVQFILAHNRVEPLPVCTPGSFFVRHQVEVVGDIDRYASLIADEEIEGDSQRTVSRTEVLA